MNRKIKIFWAICIIVCLIIVAFPQKPKLISNITTMDTAYLTILVDWRATGNREKLEKKILQMCREDSFDSMKLETSDKEKALNWNISVYSGRKEFEKGKVLMTIKYEEGD